MIWVNRHNQTRGDGVGSPGQRAHHAMAYDSDRGVTVFFGGEIGKTGSETYFNDTWEYDGTNAWRPISVPDPKPSPRSFHSMAYDRARHKVVLYGGQAGADSFAETWVYTGDGLNGTWSNVSAIVSAGVIYGQYPYLAGSAMTFDSTRAYVVLLGGWNGIYTGTQQFQCAGPSTLSYLWDGTAWQSGCNTQEGQYPTDVHINGSGFPAIYGLSMAFDESRGKAIALGGYTQANEQGLLGNHFYEYTPGVGWKDLGAGPDARAEAVMAYDSRRQRVVLVGGLGATDVGAQALEYTPSAGWVDLPSLPPLPSNGAPSGRAGAAMVYDSRRGVFVLMGGAGAGAEKDVTGDVTRGPGSRFSDTWELVPERVTIDAQPVDLAANPCKPATFSVQAHGTGTVTYQWRLDGAPLTNDAYYSGVTSTQLVIQPVLFTYGGNYDVVMGDDCGGQSVVTSRVAKLTVNPGAQWALRTTNGPGARVGAAMAYDSQRHVTVLFGGNGMAVTNLTEQNDLWEWDGEVWTLRMPNALTNSWAKDKSGSWHPRYDTPQPVPRQTHSMAYDSLRKRVVMFGGRTFDPQGFEVFMADTWEWDGGSWSLRDTNGPPAGYSAGTFPMAYDSDRQVSVLYRGSEAGVWEWDGTNWQHSPTFGGPGENVSGTAAMAYDSFRHLSLFGPTEDSLTPQDYFWSWDGFSLSYAGPAFGIGPFASFGAMVYESNRRRDVFFGGAGGPNDFYANNTTASWDGKNWSLVPDTDQTSLFSTNDFVNASSLIAKLQAHTNIISEFVWTNLPTATQLLLTDPSSPLDQQQTNLAAGLNAILQGNPIYNTARFAGVPLSAETVVLSRIFLYGPDLVRFNRLLLEDAYLEEIARSLSAPSTRFSHAMAYDSQRHAVVLQGGQNSWTNGYPQFTGNETWELLAVDSPMINQQPISQVHKVGETATFSVSAVTPAGSTVRYSWRKANKALADGVRISGSSSPQLQITNLAAADAGLYRVRVTCECGVAQSRPALLTFDSNLQMVSADGTLTLVWNAAANIILQQADSVNGPWTPVPGATSPFTIAVSSAIKLYRLHPAGP